MKTYTLDQLYDAGDQALIRAMGRFFKVESDCLECIQKLLPAHVRTQTYDTTDLDGRALTLHIPRAEQFIARALASKAHLQLIQWTPEEIDANTQTFGMCYYTPHLDHIPDDQYNRPGIMLELGIQDQQHIVIPIDGSHRAMRCLRDGHIWTAYLIPPALIPYLTISPQELRTMGEKLRQTGFFEYLEQEQLIPQGA